MLDNEQIVADLENNCSDYYYCMNGTKQVIRKIYRDELGKLYVTLPNWGTVPLERCPETLIRRVPTLSLEDTDDKLKERLRMTAQILVAEVGADGPMDAEDVALKAVELIKGLRDEIKTVRKAAQALEAEVERLKEELQAEKQSAMESIGAWQITAGEWGAKCHHLQIEVAQLKAHTWQQERAAVVKWLRPQADCGSNTIKTIVTNLCVLIERGEHWPEGGTL